MIVLDTHIWIWWVHGDPQLPDAYRKYLEETRQDFGISAISCWEVAKLVEYERLVFALLVEEWMQKALSYPKVQLLELTPRIAIESTQLPQPFHRDPADQIIVATARIFDCALMTKDEKILQYPHVQKLP